MRISALSSVLLLGSLLGSAHADRKDRPPAHPAVALGPVRGDRPDHADRAPSLSTGDLALTGPARSARPARPDLFLTAGEITTHVAPHASEIERCYLDRLGDARRGGHLDLTLVITRDGGVLSLKAAASGLPVKTARKVEACIREIVETMQFPARRNDTTAVVPYVFQKTDAPGTGPLLSCWNPKGC
jgi:hypothetical protein